MKDHEQAVWEGNKISMLCHYEWPTVHDKLVWSLKCDYNSPAVGYWVAVDGECFGMTGNDTTCLANLESMLGSAGAKRVYSTFALKDRTIGSWKRWRNKWSKRTTTADWMDGSVRVTV